jgi:hypothetical protein
MCCTSSSGSWADILSSSNAVTNVTNPAKARAWLGPKSNAGAATTTNNVNVGLDLYGYIGAGATFAVNPFSSADSLYTPVWIAGRGTRHPAGIKGMSTLFYYGSVLRTYMDTATTVGTRDMVYINHTWSPWDGSVPTL